MSPRSAAYYTASAFHAVPGPSPTPLRWHVLLSVSIGLVLWSVMEQRWSIAAVLTALIAMLAVFMARKIHGCHLPPSRVLVTGMLVTLNLPFAELLVDLPWLSVAAFVIGTTVAFAAFRLDQRKRHHQLATGNFSYRDLW